jgi:transcriptional regulator with XRE-family HTH domain
MGPTEFRSWRERLELSQQAAADVLGMSKSSIELYERGSRRDDGRSVLIPTTVALACGFLEQRARLQRQIKMFDTGKLWMREARRGEMVDTTAEHVATLRRWISDLDNALSQAKKWHPRDGS